MEDARAILERLSDDRHARAAFNELYTTFAPTVRTFAACLLKNEAEADDITHDIFLKVWTKRKSIKEIANFQSYLFMMAKNAVINRFHHISVERKCKEYFSIASDVFSEDLQEKLDNDELILLLEIAIENFPTRRKEIFMLSRFEGLSYKEIAERLEISQKTVEGQISSALAALRKIALAIVPFFM
ncbi:MAG: RNA polymerase sigma-70 factor [Bacteroidales bacterium]|nr:RNA polymerase sigma-70 factor [Bacteroides sp.]MCM1197852.1 RNA polymerase sigma-70 factor [Clostridium sp.]MCM1503317.1 RNA polymerase sigma-70 factor [Bacteroidales bacterium]